MTQTLLCTNCYRDTGCASELAGTPSDVVIAIVTNWRCNDCLDAYEDAPAAHQGQGPSGDDAAGSRDGGAS